MNNKIRALAVAAMLLCSFVLIAYGLFGDFGGGNENVRATLSLTQSTYKFKAHNGASETKKPTDAVTQTTADSGAKATYILNSDSKVYHHPWCAYTDIIDAENRETVNASKDVMLQKGFKPCSRCKP